MHKNQKYTNTTIKRCVLITVTLLFSITGCQQFSKKDHSADNTASTDTPYQRKDWPHWVDQDKDCQNTRQEMLIATSKIAVKFKNANRCTVKSGLWIGPYTGRKFTNAADVDIDHIVPLAHAHRHGANKWTLKQRRNFANDFENLLVVDDATNRKKSDKAPHEWLPPNKEFWCQYGNRWQRIKDKYRLFYSKRETMVLKQLAKNC